MILDIKEEFLTKFVFLEKKQLSNHGKIQSFFSRKTHFAKNFSLMSKILLSSKQIYILYLSWEKVVVNFPIFLTNVKYFISNLSKTWENLRPVFSTKKKGSKSWEKRRHVKIQQVRRRIINNDLPRLLKMTERG